MTRTARRTRRPRPSLACLRARLGGRDRGSVTVWMITTALAMTLLVGLAVDLSGQVHARQRAQQVAAAAARAGGQQLHGPAAVRGQGAGIDPAAAAAAAAAYLAGSDGVTGSATVTAGTVTVTTETSYATKFLTLIGIRALTATGHAQVEPGRAVRGVAR